MTPRIITGYIMREQLARVRNSNCTARQALKQLLDTAEPSRQMTVALIAKAATALAEGMDALVEIDSIVRTNNRLSGS